MKITHHTKPINQEFKIKSLPETNQITGGEIDSKPNPNQIENENSSSHKIEETFSNNSTQLITKVSQNVFNRMELKIPEPN